MPVIPHLIFNLGRFNLITMIALRFIATSFAVVGIIANSFAQWTSERVQKSIDSLLVVGKKGTFDYIGFDRLPEPWEMTRVNYPWGCPEPECGEDRFGIWDEAGQRVLAPVFTQIDWFVPYIFLAADKWSAVVSPTLKVERVFPQGSIVDGSVIKIRKENKWGIVDRKFRERMVPLYDDIKVHESPYIKSDDSDPDYFFIVKENNKWGLVDPDNKRVFGFEFDKIERLDHNLLIAKKGKFGVISQQGALIAPFKYDTIYRDVGYGTYVVANRLFGLIDSKGKELTPFIYNSIGNAVEGTCRCVKRNGKWAVLDIRSGKELTPPVFDEVIFYNLNQIPMRKGKKWGFYNCTKKAESTPFIYDEVTAFYGYEADVLINGAKKRIPLK